MTTPFTSTMMSQNLSISSLLMHACRFHADVEVVSRRVEGDIHRYTYKDLAARSQQLANALTDYGLQQGQTVGTLAWNGYRHLELYYAVSGMGAICHTINPRLFPEQIIYIINHAEDRVVFFDATFLPLIEGIAAHCPQVEQWILMVDADKMPQTSALALLNYEQFMGQYSSDYIWPDLDETLPASLCYTSGTTGDPKGVVYSHRSTVLHAIMCAMPDAMGLGKADVLMPVVPMFHVNAWGMPYLAPMIGSKLVLPGPKMDAPSLYELFEQEAVTIALGVPTIWLGLLNHVIKNQLTFSTFNRTVIGGAACPASVIEMLDSLGVETLQAWGMTETSPLGTISRLSSTEKTLPLAERVAILTRQGGPIYGVDMKIIDDNGMDLPWDNRAFGDLYVRGFAVTERYFKSAHSSTTHGWFPTGDVATINSSGSMLITDRSKDVIKSGGEWISSIELENIGQSYPNVQLVACIGVAHPKWDERPLMVVVPKDGVEIDKADFLQFFEGKVAKFCQPDDMVLVTELPLTATGKLQKRQLREQFKDFVLQTVVK